MTASANNRIFVVSSDQAFYKSLTAAAASEGFAFTMIEAPREAAVSLGTEEVAALVVDSSRIPAADRDPLARVHRERGGFSLFMLETPDTLSPKEPGGLRRLVWPLPQGFIDAVRAVEAPVVFLVEPSLFAAGAFQGLLPDTGIQPAIMESHLGIADFLKEQLAKAAAPPPTPKKRSIWEKIKGGEQPEAPPSAPVIQRIVLAMFPGTAAQAEAFESELKKELPEARCYLATGGDPRRLAVKAVQDGQPAFMMRDAVRLIPGILQEAAGKTSSRPVAQEKETVILLDSDKQTQDVMAQALHHAGYQVIVVKEKKEMDGEDMDVRDMEARVAEMVSRVAAGRAAEEKGDKTVARVHLAVVGTAMAFAKVTSRDVATRLRQADPDLRMVFIVDKYPIDDVVERMGAVVELGVDDILVKQVFKAVHLLGSAEKALEKRRKDAEIKRLNAELTDKNRQLEQINSFQTKFFHTVSHDVKNPLTAILGYCEVITNKFKGNAEAMKYATHIHSAAKFLNGLISDLVDAAAIESGKLRVDTVPMDLGQVVGEVKSRIDVVAAQRKINFAVELPQAPLPVQGDPQRLGQVIQNLCTNAMQYTKEGGSVTVRVDLLQDWMTVSVIDTGIGIAKEDIPRVWEKYFQTAEAQKMRKGGFGLGLKIAREIVQRHGGEMGIESEIGKGSRFFFHLPVRK